MKKRAMPARKLPALADFRTPKQIATTQADVWALLAKWQREGLISIKPETSGCAMVSLTEAGEAAIA